MVRMDEDRMCEMLTRRGYSVNTTISTVNYSYSALKKLSLEKKYLVSVEWRRQMGTTRFEN